MSFYISNGLTFPAMQVLYVGLARAKDSPRDFANLFLLSVENLAGVLWPAYALLAVLAQPVILVLYGSKWLQAAPLLSLTCCGGMLLTACYVHMRALTALGRIRVVVAIEAFVMACRIGLLLPFSAHGIFAAVAAAVLPTALGVPLYWWAMRQHVELSWRQAAPRALRAATLTGLTVLPAALLRPFHFQAPLLVLFLGMTLGGTSWIASLYILHHPLKEEVSRLIAWARSAIAGGVAAQPFKPVQGTRP
jgi:O-antigen/teichoic acid export membrane protein